jgi:RNA polymerase sigma factor (sigma-70 family)
MAAYTKVRDRVGENRSDVSLAERAVGGDMAAWNKLYVRYKALFFLWMRGWLKHKEWAEDCAVAGVEALYEALPQYKPERSAFSTWAYRVAYTGVIKFIRDSHDKRNDISSDELLAEVIPALHGPKYDYIMRRLHEEVDRLEPMQHAAVAGHFFYGYSDQEISDLYNIPRRKVCYRRRQGIVALAKRLSDIAFMSIRPETLLSGYNYMMTNDEKENENAQPGGKEGE